jgi:hypothetical protein
MKTFSHQRPVRDEAGQIISQKPAPVSRVTVAELGGQFGADRTRRLVVSLKAGDLIEFRPERTRQTITMLAADLYRSVIRAQAQSRALEKARATKAAKLAKRQAIAIRSAEKRLVRPL